MSDEALEQFARELAAEVEESVETGDGSVYPEIEFTRLILNRLGDDAALDNPTLLWQEGVFESTKYKITGFSISDADDRLLLVTTVFTGDIPPRSLTAEETRTAVFNAANFYKCSRDGLHEKIEPSNTEASDLARRIFEIREQLDVLRVVVISDGLTGLNSIDVKAAKDGTRIIVDLFGIERLHRILGEGLTRDDIFVDLQADNVSPLPCIKVPSATADYEAYLTAFPAEVLANIYEKYGTRLLELNVRAFLGVRGRKSVNAGLRHTILEEPNRFLAYNNGVVATADVVDISCNKEGLLRIRSIRGLQIVNGGQTTASLHRTRKQDKAKLDGIMVPAKIITMRGEGLDAMVAAVSRSANSQNTIQPADFSANDPFHVAVETLANNTWLPGHQMRWFYERARGSYGAAEQKASGSSIQQRRFAKETPKNLRFSKTDVAKYLNAWDGFPHLVSYGSQKNFQYFMQMLAEAYPDGLKPDIGWFKAFVAKAIIFRAVQGIVKARKFPAYQANITAYTVALFGFKTGGQIDWELVWSHQAISPELRTLFDIWSTGIDAALRRTAGSRMPSEWAKRSECWTEMQAVELELPNPAPPEVQVRSSLEEDVREVLARTKAPDDNPESDPSDLDRDKLILKIRELFNRGGARDRGDVIVELARQLGYRRTGPRIREELDNLLRTAVRRGILENRGDGLALSAHTVADYERDVLKEQFLASMPSRSWTERDDGIRTFARWLGFRRTGANIEETAKSLINGLIRDGNLEADGTRIRRRG